MRKSPLPNPNPPYPEQTGQMRASLPVVLLAVLCMCSSAAAASPTLTASPSTVSQSGLVNISWLGADATSTHDWIAFWQLGATPSLNPNQWVPQSWRFTYGGMTALRSANNARTKATGTIALTAPSKPGNYSVYYCIADGSTCVASVAVRVIAAQPPSRLRCSREGKSTIKHLVIIQTENHSFDSTFGAYCKAPPGSIPRTSYGPTACEAPPASLNGFPPLKLDDAQNTGFDPDHSASGETCAINGGAMDRYVSGCPSSDRRNFAVMDTAEGGNAAFYGRLASSSAFSHMNSAIADRFFQPAIGASSSNDMFIAIPHFMFRDNQVLPQNCSLNGSRCYCGQPASSWDSFYAPTIFDLLNQCAVDWAIYAQGYAANAGPQQCYGDYMDASDFAQAFFPSLTKAGANQWRDSAQFFSDVQANQLPSVSHVRALGRASEHPGWPISPSIEFLTSITAAIEGSEQYSSNTLILIMPDESGGFYDHVSPPAKPNPMDGVFYGPRIGAIAVGAMVKAGAFVSHQVMETSSVIKFMEWNWLDGQTGQLGARDTVVSNLGSFLNASRTGVRVPDF